MKKKLERLTIINFRKAWFAEFIWACRTCPALLNKVYCWPSCLLLRNKQNVWSEEDF